MKKTNDETFVKITNKEVYKMFESMKEENRLAHEEIIQHQLKTNGKVKLAYWLGSTALTVALLSIGFAFNILGG